MRKFEKSETRKQKYRKAECEIILPFALNLTSLPLPSHLSASPSHLPSCAIDVFRAFNTIPLPDLPFFALKDLAILMCILFELRIGTNTEKMNKKYNSRKYGRRKRTCG